MKSRLISFGSLAGLAVILTGCVDNDYDLSNIDTTSEIKVNNLTLPVKMDAITLNDIFDIEEGSKIQTVTVNGQEFYAVTQHGDISSQSIDIPAFTTFSPTIAETNATFELQLPDINTRADLPSLEYRYNLKGF